MLVDKTPRALEDLNAIHVLEKVQRHFELLQNILLTYSNAAALSALVVDLAS